jgi:hypothetical protein
MHVLSHSHDPSIGIFDPVSNDLDGERLLTEKETFALIEVCSSSTMISMFQASTGNSYRIDELWDLVGNEICNILGYEVQSVTGSAAKVSQNSHLLLVIINPSGQVALFAATVCCKAKVRRATWCCASAVEILG